MVVTSQVSRAADGSLSVEKLLHWDGALILLLRRDLPSALVVLFDGALGGNSATGDDDNSTELDASAVWLDDLESCIALSLSVSW